MKKLFLTILALVLCSSMFSCDGGDSFKSKDSTTTATTAKTTTTTQKDSNGEPEAPECSHQYNEGKCALCGATDPDYVTVTPSEGLAYELNEDGTAYTVIGIGTCADTDVVIPSQHEGLPVTSIGDKAFYFCSNLTSITIPKGVINIGVESFYFCSNLASITIPDSVMSIDNFAFYECSSLTSITVPNSVMSIGIQTFSGCSSLTSISVDINNMIYRSEGNCLVEIPTNTLIAGCNLSVIVIPNDVTSIGDGAFRGCSNLTSISIPDGVMSIGDFAFYGCSSLTSISIPDDVMSIGDFAFYGCSSLTSITIPNGVTSIGDWAFRGCSNLTSITIPDSVTSIGDCAFDGCSNLTSISIPNGVTSIGDDAFYGCSSLTSITIPNGVTSIGDDAFCGCSNLTSITIPDSVTSIGDNAFGGCSNLTIYCEAVSKPEGWNDEWNPDNRPIIWSCKTKITLDGDLSDWHALKLATISCIGVADPDVPNSENKKAIFYGTLTDKGLYLACEAYHDTYVPDSTSGWWKNTNFEFFIGRGNAQKYVYARGIDQDCSTSGTDVIAVMKTTQVDQATKYVTITEVFVAMEELDESEIYYNTINVGVAWKTEGEYIVGGAGTVRDGADDYWVPVGTWPSGNDKAIVAPSGIYIPGDY